MKRFLVAALAVVGLGRLVQAAEVPNQAVIANEAALAYSTTFFLDISQAGKVAMQVNVGSATIAGATFTDGSVSTGNITVASFVALASATATGSITISSNSQTVNTCVSGGGAVGFGSFNVCNPANWTTDSASSQTAQNLAAAINTAFGVTIATSGSVGAVVYTSAPVAGAAWNTFTIAVSSYGALTPSVFVSSVPYQLGYASMSGVGIGTLTGGRDAQSVTVNGKKFTAGTDFPVNTSNAVTATNLAAAVNASSVTIGVVAAAGATSTTVVFATSTAVGTSTNYTMVTSSYAVLLISSSGTMAGSQATSTMKGGTNSAYAINTSTIALSGNAFTQGLTVVYSTGSTTVLNGLTYGTTYFVIKNAALGTGNIALATTLANAQVGAAVQLTSSQTATTANSFLLTPQVITGAPVLKWLVSEDKTNWSVFTAGPQAAAVNTLSVGSYVNPSSSTFWDPGQVDYSWLGLAVTAPTAGGITLKAFVTGKQ